MEAETNKQNKNSKIFWILVVLFGLPYILAFVYYQFKDALPEQATSNHGDLISPVRSIAKIDLLGVDGKSLNSQLAGKWVLLTVASSSCAESCQKNLYHIRQVHKAMSGENLRVKKLLVLNETSKLMELKEKLDNYSAMSVAIGSDSSIKELTALLRNPNPSVENGIYMIDPLGNYMMSYPENFDANLIIKDLERLLKVSQVG